MPDRSPRSVGRCVALAAAALLLGFGCAVAQTKGPAAAPAADADDCGGRRAGTPDERIAGCTQIIESRRASAAERAVAFRFRAIALRQKKEFDRALADHDQSIKLNPKVARAFESRALTLLRKNEFDRAIADLDQAIKLEPRNAVFFTERGSAFRQKGDYDRAIADHSESIRLDPKLANAYNARGYAYRHKGDLDRAMADFDQAIRLNPAHLAALANRASLWRAKGDLERAIADLDEAIRAHPKATEPLVVRGQIHESRNDRTRAEADFRAALASTASSERAEKAKDTARTRLALLTSGEPAPAKPGLPGAAAGARVALVIGNGAYAHSVALPNPPNDARAIAAALREIGFDVSEGIDLAGTAQEQLVRAFLRKASGARIALMFYAGHGLQVDNKNYLVPVDAKLAARTDLQFEALDLERILSGLDDENRTNVIILDACRDNPLAKNLAARARSSAGGGLATVSVGTGSLVVFATEPNKTALDGDGANSPFTTALLKHIRTPGLEVRQMISRVRAEVYAQTKKVQLPWDNSSLLGDVYLAGASKL